MSIEVKVPHVGESIEEVTIDQWLKQAGDMVQEDEPLVILETDKTTVELPAPATGVLEGVQKQAGDRALIDEVIALINLESARDGAGAAAPAASAAPPPAQEKKAEKKEKEKDAKAKAPAEGKAGPPEAAAPAVAPSKPGSAPAAPGGDPAPAPDSAAAREERAVPMSPIRRRIAERLVEAQRNAALLTTFNKVDMSRVIDIRRRHQEAFQKKYGIKLGFMSFFVKASVEALKRVPEINAEIRGDHIVYRNYYDIGIAIGSERGLVVPILRNAERLSFAAIEQQIADFARRANEKRLEIHELQGGTFTISNGGVYGSMLSTPIVNPPQSGVLGLHAIEDQPVALDGAVAVRPMMYLALSYDHRIVDGREAVGFLKTIKEVVEDPASILLEL